MSSELMQRRRSQQAAEMAAGRVHAGAEAAGDRGPEAGGAQPSRAVGARVAGELPGELIRPGENADAAVERMIREEQARRLGLDRFP